MIIILGKNGAGKSYLLGRLAEKGFCRVVGYTTRPMREKEVDGSDYFFVTQEQFEELIKQGFFIEHKKLGENYYGTPKDAINSHSVMIAGNVADLKKLTEEEIIHSQAKWLDCQAKDIFPGLYFTSGIRSEAVQKLISPEMAETSRYLLKIWSIELLKHLHQQTDGHGKLQAIWNDPVFQNERDVFYELQERGPIPGMRFEGDY